MKTCRLSQFQKRGNNNRFPKGGARRQKNRQSKKLLSKAIEDALLGPERASRLLIDGVDHLVAPAPADLASATAAEEWKGKAFRVLVSKERRLGDGAAIAPFPPL